MGIRFRLGLVAVGTIAAALAPAHLAAAAPATQPAGLSCASPVTSGLCAEVWDSEAVFGANTYIGHDEPSALFYSGRPGSGNNNHYLLRLPKDPPVQPNGSDTGGTFNFMLHPAFWFGMAMCDTQSAPNFTNRCSPDSDANIFDDANPNSPRYIGRHPGTAFMEMQFYPPGWAQWGHGGNSCATTTWCAALNVDSLSENQNVAGPGGTALTNNADCLVRAGIEPVNFAFITRNGRSQAPAGPLSQTTTTFTPDPNQALFMRSGDLLSVDLFDTHAGFRVVIADLTSRQVGSMTASVANGFAQVDFQPAAATCSQTPYAFHPMYSTSSEHTRVPWAAHSYNVAFSDEIGHFQFCNTVNTANRTCSVAGGRDAGSPPDGDDRGCVDASQLAPGSVLVSGCRSTNVDFDGPEYFANWPGTAADPRLDRQIHAQPIRFTSPTFGDDRQFSRVAFETDLPRVENATNPPCDRITGANCVNPAVSSTFYPFFTTHRSSQEGSACMWQEGGAHLPGTTNDFGGSSATAYGPLVQLHYPGPGFQSLAFFNDFRRVVNENPCRSSGSMDSGE
jgi:hypothetical protein